MAKRGRPPHPDILTPREWQVLDLLREGLSNEQIARRLEVTERTAKWHVAEILSKLGVGNREEAAAWQPERRWPLAAFAPLLIWRKLGWGWLPATAGGVAIVAVAAGLGLLAWGLVRTEGDGGEPALSDDPPATLVSQPGVYLIRPDGSALLALLAAEPLDGSFAWSPSGDRFALVTGNETEGFELSFGSASDGSLGAVTTVPGPVDAIHWAHQGDVVAISFQGPRGVVLVDVVTGEQTAIDDAITFKGWSHDGRYFVVQLPPATNGFVQAAAIVETTTGERTMIAAEVGNVYWSPTEDRLAFDYVVVPQKPPYNAWKRSGVDVINADGTGQRAILAEENVGSSSWSRVLGWSPNGTRLLVQDASDNYRFRVFDVEDPATSADLGVANKADWGAWLPDGERVVVRRIDIVDHEEYAYFDIYRWDGTPLPRIPAGFFAKSSAVSPIGGRVAYTTTRCRYTNVEDLYVRDLAGGPTAVVAIAEQDQRLSFPTWSADGVYLAFHASSVAPGRLGCNGDVFVDPHSLLQ
ncbi:MAG: hypothetical protein IH958_03845 [Chloroflexi bacterium]|nr:hypothetical protein [Chloroflexota bacterium]